MPFFNFTSKFVLDSIDFPSNRTGRENSEAGPSGSTSNRPDYSAILGDIEIPEGVDPSFLAALPEDMRQEVIAEQLR